MKNWKNFERDTAKMFAEALGGEWFRVPSSGAYTGGKNAERKARMSAGQIRTFNGDIVPPDKWDFIEVECKTRKTFSFKKVLEGKNTELDSWLEQTYQHNPIIGLLIFKFSYSPIYIAYKYPFTPKRNYIRYYSKKLDQYFCIHEVDVEWLKNASSQFSE